MLIAKAVPKKFYELRVKPGLHSFHRELSTQEVWGYDNMMPGPTFVARYGEPVMVRIFNELPTNHVGYRPCPAPGPLEDYAVQFDLLFNRLSQRQSFRTYLAGLLLPRDRPKTLTAIAGAEPWVQAQSPKVQQLQFFLSDSVWDANALAARTVELLRNEPATAPNNDGLLVLDDTETPRRDRQPIMSAVNIWARSASSTMALSG